MAVLELEVARVMVHRSPSQGRRPADHANSTRCIA